MWPKLNPLKKRKAIRTTENFWIKEPSTREKIELTEDLYLHSNLNLKLKRLKFSLRKESPELLTQLSKIRIEHLHNIHSSSTWSQFTLRKPKISRRKKHSRNSVKSKGKPLKKLCRVSSYSQEQDHGGTPIWRRETLLMTLQKALSPRR